MNVNSEYVDSIVSRLCDCVEAEAPGNLLFKWGEMRAILIEAMTAAAQAQDDVWKTGLEKALDTLEKRK